MADWMIYGATGYTGALVAEEAVRRGHRPLLAGRSPEKLRSLAQRLGLDYVAVSIEDAEGLMRAVQRVELVYHAAGPFIHTAEPMLRACLAAGAHYLDITGEIPVYQMAFSYDAAAQEKGIAIIPGVGFDVVPSDCLIGYVADKLPGATHLDVVIDSLGAGSGEPGISAGTAKSMVELVGRMGNLARRDGVLVNMPFGAGARTFPLQKGQRLAMPIPWGDLEIGWRTSGIPNITTYLTLPPAQVRLLRLTGGLTQALMRLKPARDLANGLIDRFIDGPSEHARETGKSYIYVQARDAAGKTAQAWLETAEGYQFTALAGVRAVERVLDGSYSGATTPSLAFGADFVLDVPGSRRWDERPGQ